MKKMRKGFTLVELLIIVAILGILSATMMMSMKDSTPKAKASQIMSDLRTIAAAIPLYEVDANEMVAAGATMAGFIASSDDYVLATKLSNYTITAGTGNHWKATCQTVATGVFLKELQSLAANNGANVTNGQVSMTVR